MPIPGDGTAFSGTLPEENQQGRLIMLENAQYVRFRQGHGLQRICQVEFCKQGDGRRGRRHGD
jgi:hypothetical protein